MANHRRIKTVAVIVMTLLSAHWLTPAFQCKSPVAATAESKEERRNIAAAGVVGNAAKQRAENALDKLPLHFEEDDARAANGSRFIARGAGLDFSITPTEVVMRLPAGQHSAAPFRDVTPARIADVRDSEAAPASPTRRQTVSLRMQLVGANRRARVTGETQVTSRTNYFIGCDPKKWRTNVPTYSLGGSGRETASGVAVDSSGNAYVTGRTTSTDFPTTPGALQGANASSTAFKSTDGGTTWSAINRGLRSTDLSVNQLVLDPITASTLYANTDGGLFKSTDGGDSWRFLTFGFITTFAIDPINPSTLYAGYAGLSGVFGKLQKSTDAGKTWFLAGSGLSPNIAFSILIDPKDPTTLYAAAQLVQGGGQSAGIFKSTDSGINWFPSARGVSQLQVRALALAPTKPKRLYAFSGGWIFKSTNSGKKWKPGGFSSNLFAASLAVDPLNPNTIYLGTSAGVSKSTDGAETWASTPLHANIGLLAVDPKNPSTIYAAGRDVTNVDRNFKSTDGGESWKAIGRISVNFVATFAIDPNNTSIVYAGSFSAIPSVPSADAFVAKINPTGTALVYSTYLGGTGDDIAKAIEVDAQGNAYLTGQTSSEDFLIKSALQPRKLGSPAGYDAFLTKLDPSGDPIYSSYLGGSSNDDGRAIALDDAGGLYIVGSTDSDDFPTVNPIQRTRNGRLAIGFVTKVVDAASDGGAFSQARHSR